MAELTSPDGRRCCASIRDGLHLRCHAPAPICIFHVQWCVRYENTVSGMVAAAAAATDGAPTGTVVSILARYLHRRRALLPGPQLGTVHTVGAVSAVNDALGPVPFRGFQLDLEVPIVDAAERLSLRRPHCARIPNDWPFARIVVWVAGVEDQSR